MALKESLLAEYDHEIATTRRLLERVPADRLTWKPHAKSMSLGGLAQHMANIPNWGAAVLESSAFDLASASPHLGEPGSHAAIMALFEESTTRTRRSLDRTDGELSALWTLKRGDAEVFAMPRFAAFRTFIISHLIHHRGQLSVYLRLNDVAVPAIYGPSADEG